MVRARRFQEYMGSEVQPIPSNQCSWNSYRLLESNWSSMSQSDDRASNIYWKIANWFCQNL